MIAIVQFFLNPVSSKNFSLARGNKGPSIYKYKFNSRKLLTGNSTPFTLHATALYEGQHFSGLYTVSITYLSFSGSGAHFIRVQMALLVSFVHRHSWHNPSSHESPAYNLNEKFYINVKKHWSWQSVAFTEMDCRPSCRVRFKISKWCCPSGGGLFQ